MKDREYYLEKLISALGLPKGKQMRGTVTFINNIQTIYLEPNIQLPKITMCMGPEGFPLWLEQYLKPSNGIKGGDTKGRHHCPLELFDEMIVEFSRRL